MPPFDPRRRERRLGVDRRWYREDRDPERRSGPDDRREADRRSEPERVSPMRQWLRRVLWNDRSGS